MVVSRDGRSRAAAPPARARRTGAGRRPSPGATGPPTRKSASGSSIASKRAVRQPRRRRRSRGGSARTGGGSVGTRRLARAARPDAVSRHGRHRVRAVDRRRPGEWSVVPDPVRDVLLQVAAGGHRHDLHATTDPSSGTPLPRPRRRERQLHGVAVGPRLLRPRGAAPRRTAQGRRRPRQRSPARRAGASTSAASASVGVGARRDDEDHARRPARPCGCRRSGTVALGTSRQTDG